jgi:hypothetical protein
LYVIYTISVVSVGLISCYFSGVPDVKCCAAKNVSNYTLYIGANRVRNCLSPFYKLSVTVVAIEVLITYCNNSLPNIDQFIWSKIAQLPVYWHACSQLVNQSLKRKAIG